MDIPFDFGNARIKWFNPRDNSYGDIRHAIVAIDESEWRAVVGRHQPPEGFIKVNGSPYVVGDQARRYIIPERPRGAARYRADYYGVGMCYALSEAVGKPSKSTRRVNLIATHAPQDFEYREHQRAAAAGHWEVETHTGNFTFHVQDVLQVDEPLGGYMHFTFTEKGTERRNNPLADVTTLVVDAGGHTVDVAAIDEGGEIDLMSLHSTRTGVLDMTERFEKIMRANNRTMFMDAGDLDIRRVERAIKTGVYKMGKVQVDCAREANDAMNGLVNDVMQIIRSAGGVENFDVFLLTGGGAAMLFDKLQEAIPRGDFVLAEPKRELMMHANVFGAAKLAALLRKLGEY